MWFRGGARIYRIMQEFRWCAVGLLSMIRYAYGIYCWCCAWRMLSRAHCCPVSNSKINEWLATYAIEGSADISSDARIPLRRAIFHDRLDKIRYDTIRYDTIRYANGGGLLLVVCTACLNIGLSIANKRRWEMINLTIPFKFGWGMHIVMAIVCGKGYISLRIMI
jgi:hypothetical protein